MTEENTKPDVLFPPDEIARRVSALGGEVTRAFAGREVCVVGLMKSCLVFMADLIRDDPARHDLPLPAAPRLRDGGRGRRGRTSSTRRRYPTRDSDILLLDDIVDTGITLSYLLDHIRERRPRSLKVCALIDKPGDRKIDVQPDWAAFTLGEPLRRPLHRGVRARLRGALPRAAVHRHDSPAGAPAEGARRVPACRGSGSWATRRAEQ